jgi:hypothetical protein
MQPIGRKDSIQTVCRKSRRFEAYLFEAAQKFEVFQIFKIKIKKSKPYSGTTFMQIYVIWPDGGTYNLSQTWFLPEFI